MLDQVLLSAIQRKLIETPNGGASWDSGLWTHEEVLAYLRQHQNRFLEQTHGLVTRTVIPEVIGQSRYALPDDWLATLRVERISATGDRRELPIGDTFQADHAQPSWPSANGTPVLYADAEHPTKTFQLVPAPDTLGSIVLTYIPLAPVPTGRAMVLLLPDEWASMGLQYGVLGAMLSKVGRGQDLVRARYCQERFGLAVTAAQILLGGWA